MELSNDSHQTFSVWITLFNVPIEYWTPLGLSWIASGVGKPLHLDPSTARMERVHFARICGEVSKNASLPTKIRVKAGVNDLALAVDIEVDYQWRPGHKVFDRSTTPKSSRKFTPAHQDVAPLNLTPNYSSEERGLFSSMDGLNTVDSPQYVNLGNAKCSALEQESSDAMPKVPVERALPPMLAKEGPVDQTSENSAMQDAGAFDCKAVIGPGDAGELTDFVQRPELLVRVDEEIGFNSEQHLLVRMGQDAQFLPSDAVLSPPDLDGCCPNSITESRNSEQRSREFMASVETIPCHDSHTCSIAYVDVVRRGLKDSNADLPSRCAAPLPITEEDRLAALGSSPRAAEFSDPYIQARACSSIGELRRNIAEMRSQLEAVRSRSASPSLQ